MNEVDSKGLEENRTRFQSAILSTSCSLTPFPRWRRHPGEQPGGVIFRYFDYNLSDELTAASDRNQLSQLLDSQQWGLDLAGNWLSVSQASGSLMQTRTHNIMNRLEQIGGQGQVVVEGTVNEHAQVSVNNVPAALFEDPLLNPEAYRYRATVPVNQGTNILTVTATDQDQDVTTNQWEINVPAAQRTFTYDLNGNMLTDSSGRTFVWDAKSRLKRVTVGGKHYEWDYDYRDRRVREYTWNVGSAKPATCKQFIWHENDIVQERTGTSATAGTAARNHYFGGFTVGATVSTAAKYQTFTDHLGHVREVVASSGTNPAIGTLITRYEYSAYQGPTRVYQRPGTNVEATFQTIGRYYHHEPSGLELALYRAYDLELGRWISEDPLGEGGGLNLYGFVNNSPVLSVDLLGLRSCCNTNAVDEVIRNYSAMAARKTAQVADPLLRREYGGSVCCNKITGAVVGELPMREGTPGQWSRTPAGVMVFNQGHSVEHDLDYCKKKGPDWELAGFYHSHPENDPLSRDDMTMSAVHQVPVGVGLPNGVTSVGEAVCQGHHGAPHFR